MAAGNNWPLQGPGGEVKVAVNSLLHANNGDVLREAALAGMGIVLQPDFVVGEDIVAGRLVPVLPGWSVPPIGIHAVYASRRGQVSSATGAASGVFMGIPPRFFSSIPRAGGKTQFFRGKVRCLQFFDIFLIDV